MDDLKARAAFLDGAEEDSRLGRGLTAEELVGSCGGIRAICRSAGSGRPASGCT